MTLKKQLIKHIAENGPISVADYMAQACAHYYATRDPFGAQGDFTTAPEISQIFGELIGAWLADCWQQLGEPRAILCELGPGRGTLMKDILRATRNIAGFHDAIDIVMMETSPTLQKLQKDTLHTLHPSITWCDSLNTLSPTPLLLIANEFFDALPIHQHMKIDGAWQERKVDYKASLPPCGLGRGELPPPPASLHSATSPVEGEVIQGMGAGTFFWTPQGEVFCESSPVSTNIMARIASHISKNAGAALVIDYGYTGGSRGDTLQAVHKHQFTDPLGSPGEADITAHVDFATLLHTAKGRGVYTWGAIEQGTFLKRLGAELRATALCKNAAPDQQKAILAALERLVSPEQMGVLFKVIAVTSSQETPEGF